MACLSPSNKISDEIDARKEAHKKKVAETFRKGIKPEEVLASYNDWADTFEEQISDGFYNSPAIALEEILRRVPPECRAATRVLDVGAGTGWLGQRLYMEGFKHIDAVEPCKGMLKKLREKGVYTNEFVECIGTGHCSVPTDTYDLLVASGSMSQGHIPVSGLDEYVRVSKKGGLVILLVGLQNELVMEGYKYKLGLYIEELEKKGAWTKVERRVLPNFTEQNEGAMLIFRIV